MSTRRKVKKTLLAVGEGDTEKAFLLYLRSLYCSDGKGVKVTVRNALRKKARRKKVELVGATPAIEGLLLRILEQTVPPTTVACKSVLGRIVKTSLTEPSTYQQYFTLEAIERVRKEHTDLDMLLTLFEGG